MKKILSIILALCLMLFCVSCAKDENKNTPSATESASSANSREVISVPSAAQDENEPKSESESQSEAKAKAESTTETETETETEKETESTTEQATKAKQEETTTKNEPTASHQHKWSERKVSATCTSKGYTLKSCSCGESSKVNYTDALGHNWGKWETVKAATASTTGIKQRACSRCKKTETGTIPKIAMTATQNQTEIWKLVNEERAKEGLSSLTYRSDLQALADKRAAEIAESYSHTRPDGRSCFTVFDDYGYGNCFWGIAENIAYGYTTAADVMNGWMNSEGHRANILGDYNGIVVGVSGTYWVQLFVYE